VQSKGSKTRTVYVNQRLRRALAEYAAGLNLSDPSRALFESQKGGQFSANTMCQLFLDIYKAVGLKDASSHSGRRTYTPDWQTRALVFVCWPPSQGMLTSGPHKNTLTSTPSS